VKAVLQKVKFLAAGASFTVASVACAKSAQYASVERFGDALGFDLAAAIGIVPVLAVVIYVYHRWVRPIKWSVADD
jgi:hypothetical protein